MSPLIRVLVLSTALLFVPGAARAQGPPGAETLEVVRVSDLDFGVVVAGTSATMLPSDAGAAEFEVSAPPGSSLFITFSLPGQLVSGVSAMPVSFGGGAAEWSQRKSAAGRTAFDPAAGTQIDLERGRNVYVWLGATLSPPLMQQAGVYTGVVTLTTVIN